MVKAAKSVSILLVLALVLSLGMVAVPMASQVEASPGTHYYVNAATGNDGNDGLTPGTAWKTITYAVETGCPAGASPADPNVIHVADGLYDTTNNGEGFPIVFNKNNVSLIGAGASTTTIDGEGTSTILRVIANSVTIDGFTITNASSNDGIHLHSADNATISYNIITYNDYGVYLDNSNYCEISHNTVTDNDLDGISLENSNNNTITDNTICRNQLSCPFVYSWDGQEYILDSQLLNNAPKQEAEKSDYDNLEFLQPDNGEYLLKLTVELKETVYINELKLITVDHPIGTQIIPDKDGNLHTIKSHYTPISAQELDGTPCLDKVNARDGIYWTSNMENKDFSQSADLRDGIILRFDKPAGATNAKIAINYKNTKLPEFIHTHFGRLPEVDPVEHGKLHALLHFLQLEVWDGTKWVREGPFHNNPGSWVARDNIKSIDVSGISGDKLRIKLNSLTGLVLIDSVVVDYTADEDVFPNELSATTAADNHGSDVLSEILADDSEYLVMEQGDYANLTFDEPDTILGQGRSYVVKAKGYYVAPAVAPLEGEKPEELMGQFLADFQYAMRYHLEKYRSSQHSGIDLVDSSNNTISRNDICDNLGDGIYLGSLANTNGGSNSNQITYNNTNGGSNSNQITYNYIHGNYHGIFIDGSNNNTIMYNTISENVFPDSGIHVNPNSSGNVANCNNIEGNVPYGAWNDPGNPSLDAENNWWGKVSGPYHDSDNPGGTGDTVSDNVDFDPWLDGPWEVTPPCGTAPAGESTNSAGASKDVYTTGEPVYATGDGFPTNAYVDVYIVRDLAWTKPMAIPPDVSGDGMNSVLTDADGNLGPANVWPFPVPGEYDMVFDSNRNGIYDNGDVVDHPAHPGFRVLAPPAAVGGKAYPANKLAVLAPWIALTMLFIGSITWFTLRRRRTQS